MVSDNTRSISSLGKSQVEVEGGGYLPAFVGDTPVPVSAEQQCTVLSAKP